MDKRQIRIEGDVAIVPLSGGYEAVIDVCDIHIVQGFCWSAQPRGHTVYAYRKTRKNGVQRIFRLHREIMPAPSSMLVDHINGDGLDNRRQNLRLATVSQNQQNRAIDRNSTSGFKGVSFSKRNCKWRAQIRASGRPRHIGYFNTPEEASAAYNKVAEEVAGPFAMKGGRRARERGKG